ncbi:Ubiquinone biosynthesis monooxygenase COQ6, partial [Blattella germanica]
QAPKLSGKKILLLEGSPKQIGELKPNYSNRVSSLNPGTKTLLQSIGAWKHIVGARCKAVKKMQYCKDVAYIVENDVLLSAVNKQIELLAENVTVLYQAKIKDYELPQNDRSLNNVNIKMEDGSTYTCNLLVSTETVYQIILE